MPLNLEPSLLEALNGIANSQARREVLQRLEDFQEILGRHEDADTLAFYVSRRRIMMNELAQDFKGGYTAKDHATVATAIEAIVSQRRRKLLGLTGEEKPNS